MSQGFPTLCCVYFASCRILNLAKQMQTSPPGGVGQLCLIVLVITEGHPAAQINSRCH